MYNENNEFFKGRIKGIQGTIIDFLDVFVNPKSGELLFRTEEDKEKISAFSLKEIDVNGLTFFVTKELVLDEKSISQIEKKYNDERFGYIINVEDKTLTRYNIPIIVSPSKKPLKTIKEKLSFALLADFTNEDFANEHIKNFYHEIMKEKLFVNTNVNVCISVDEIIDWIKPIRKQQRLKAKEKAII